MRALALGVSLAVVAITTGCAGDDEQRPAPPIGWDTSGVCGEAFFWAASSDGTLAVTISVGTFQATDEPAATSFSLPDDLVDVEVVHGTRLDRYYCTDLPASGAAVTSTEKVVAGSGEVELGRRGLCSEVPGTLALRGIRTSPGTEYPSVDIDALGVGCSSG